MASVVVFVEKSLREMSDTSVRLAGSIAFTAIQGTFEINNYLVLNIYYSFFYSCDQDSRCGTWGSFKFQDCTWQPWPGRCTVSNLVGFHNQAAQTLQNSSSWYDYSSRPSQRSDDINNITVSRLGPGKPQLHRADYLDEAAWGSPMLCRISAHEAANYSMMVWYLFLSRRI